jgi:hypothetical protein
MTNPSFLFIFGQILEKKENCRIKIVFSVLSKAAFNPVGRGGSKNLKIKKNQKFFSQPFQFLPLFSFLLSQINGGNKSIVKIIKSTLTYLRNWTNRKDLSR